MAAPPPPPLTVLDGIVSCGFSNVVQANAGGTSPAQRVASQLYFNNFAMCLTLTDKQIDNAFKAFLDLPIADGRIKVMPGLIIMVKAFTQHVAHTLRLQLNPEEQENAFDPTQMVALTRQKASQSPHLQVHDTSLFPALSKYVSALQCLGSGSRVVDNDELWELVQQAYYNQLSPEMIARAFAHHVQIVNAIYNCNGGDGYHRNGGLHCGVRKAYAPKYRLNDAGEPIGDPIGVELIETPEEATSSLQYNRPTPEELDASNTSYVELFNRSQLEFLVANLPYGTAEYLQAEEALHGLDRE